MNPVNQIINQVNQAVQFGSSVMAGRTFELPKSLQDVMPAESYTDRFGNRIYPNWTVEFQPYHFNITPEVEAVKAHTQTGPDQWPTLSNFLSNFIDKFETNPDAECKPPVI